jgi:hypothetical protein
MTTLNFQHKLAPTPSGLTVTPSIGGVDLIWDDVDAKSYLIYSSDVNDRNTAALVAEQTSLSYFLPLESDTVVYVWIRCKSSFDRIDGPWSSDVNAGLACVSGLVKTVDIFPNAVTDVIIVQAPSVATIDTPIVWTKMLDVNIEGHGNPVLVQSSYDNMYDTYRYVNNPPPDMSVLIRRKLENITAGGSDLTTGTNYSPGYVTSKSFQAAWTNLNNLLDPSTSTYASATWPASGQIDHVCVYGFDFSAIPDDATIYDIRIRVVSNVSTASPDTIIYVRLNWDGSDFSSTGGVLRTIYSWPLALSTTKLTYTAGRETEQYYSWSGRYNYLTGQGLRRITAADVKNANFGVMLATDVPGLSGSELRLYNIGIEVLYTSKKIPLYHISFANEFYDGVHRVSNTYQQNLVELEDGINYNFSMDILSSRIATGDNKTLTYSNDARIILTEVKR